MRTLIAIAALCAFPQCAPPSPQPAPVPSPAPTPEPSPVSYDAGRVDAKYRAACDNLKSIGCKEGNDPLCASSMQRADKTHLTLVPTSCLTTATSKAGARSCTFVECP